MVMRKKKPKPRKPVVIEYPPLTLRPWKPPKRHLPHDPWTWKPPKMKYKYPPQFHTKAKLSCLKKIWHHFSYLGNHTFILSGHFSEHHDRFTIKSRGYQCSCTCTVAIAFSKLYQMHMWNSHMIDMILIMGDKLYSRSIFQLDKTHGCCVQPSEVFNYFYFRNVRIVMTFFTTEALKGLLVKEVPPRGKPCLAETLEAFFEVYNHGIIWTQNKASGFWKIDKDFYYFEPHDRGPVGEKWTGEDHLTGRGCAALMRFGSIDNMVDHFVKNLQCPEVNSEFVLTPVDIRHIKVVKMDCPDNLVQVVIEVKPTLSDLELILFGEDEYKRIKKARAPPPPPPPPEPEPPPPVENEEDEEMAVDFVILAKEVEGEGEGEGEGQEGENQQPYQRVTIPPERIPKLKPSTESINYFMDIRPGFFGILRGGTHQGDSSFSRNPGRQSLTNALAALVTLRIYKSHNWITEIVNDVLKLSEHIFHNLKKQRKGDMNFKIMDFHDRPIDIDNYRFAADITEFAAYGQLGSTSECVLSLAGALKVLFNSCDTCIILGPLVLAVWQEGGYYYMFDPNERDELGLVFRRSSVVQEISPPDTKASQEKIIQSISLQGSVNNASMQGSVKDGSAGGGSAGTNTGSGSKGSAKKPPPVKTGKACVTWYKTLKDLVAVYKANIPKENLFDRFHLASVKINDYVEKPEEWYNFKGIDTDKWILRGTFNQADVRFGKESRNTQCTANACAALAYTKLIDVNQWDSGVMDEILTTGDELYLKTVEKLKARDKFKDKMLMVAEIYPRFQAMGKEINLKIDDCLINGMITLSGKMNEDCDMSNVLTLKEGLELFFKENDACVVTTRGLSMAVWKDDNKNYYYFDSHGRGEDGLQSVNGTSCVVRTNSLGALTKTLEANLNPGDKDEYNISKVTVEILDLTAEGLVRPPLNAFTELDTNCAILRANISQMDAKYKLNVGKQTIANLLVALGMKKILPTTSWTPETLEEILDFGDKYYDESVKDYIGKNILAVHDSYENFEPMAAGGGGFGYRGHSRRFHKEEITFMSTVSPFGTFKKMSYRAVRGGNANVFDTLHAETNKGTFRKYIQCSRYTQVTKLRGGGPESSGNFSSSYPYVSFAPNNYSSMSRNHRMVSDILVSKMRAHTQKRNKLKAKKVVTIAKEAAPLSRSVSVSRKSSLRLDSIFGRPRFKSRTALGLRVSRSLRGGSSEAGESDRESVGTHEHDEDLDVPDSDAITTENILKEFKLGFNKFEVTYEGVIEGVLEIDGETEESSGGNSMKQIAKRIFESGEEFNNEEQGGDVGEDEENGYVVVPKKTAAGNEEGLDLEDIGEGKAILVESKYCNVVMWKEDGVYFLFDPNPRNETGHAYGWDEWSERPPRDTTMDDLASHEGEGSQEGSEEEEEEGNDADENDDDDDDMFADKPKATILKAAPPPEPVPPPPAVHPIEQEIIDMIGAAGGEGEEGSLKEAPAKIKMGSAYWLNEERMKGKAYVMWFTKLTLMVQHVLENVRPMNRLEECRVVSLSLKCSIDDKEIFDPETCVEKSDPYVGDWYRFKEMDKYQWILRGTIDLTNMRFPPHNRGKQALADSYIANVFARYYAIQQFTPRYLDYILKYGDRLHTATILLMMRDLKAETKGLMTPSKLSRQKEKLFENPPRCVMNKFAIGPRMITVTQEDEVTVGDVTAKNHPVVLDVERGLESFFEEHKFGVLTAKEVTVAVWKGAKMFYMFDPYTNDSVGVHSTIGTCCLTRFLRLKDLAELFLKNLPKEGLNRFTVDSLTFTDEPFVRDQKVLEKMAACTETQTPELSAYKAFADGKCILSASISCDDDKFQRGIPGCSAVPACVVAIAMKLAHKARTWTKPILDEIIYIGDELYTLSSDLLEFNFNPWKEPMRIEHVTHDFKLGTLRANFQLRNTDQQGVICIKHPKVLNLRRGIEMFLEENNENQMGGIIQTDTLCVAIWEDPDTSQIYMFDPNPRGPSGFATTVTNGGKACVLTFMNAKLASDHFIYNLPDEKNKNDAFVIVPIEFLLAQTRKPTDDCMDLFGKHRKKRRGHCPNRCAVADTEPHFGEYKPLSCFFRCTRWGDAKPVKIKHPKCKCKKHLRALKRAAECMDEDEIIDRRRDQRRNLREMLEERHRLRRMLEEQNIGRLKYYELPDGNAIIRGTRSICSPFFCKSSRGKQSLPTIVVEIILAKILQINRWTCKHIDICLDIGDQLYKTCYLSSKGAEMDLPYLERNFHLGNKKIHIDIYEPSIRQTLNLENVTKCFNRFFLQEAVAMVKVKNDWFSIVQKSATYFLFDPGDRTSLGTRTCPGKGTAVVVRYPHINALIEAFAEVVPESDTVDFQMNTIEVMSCERNPENPHDSTIPDLTLSVSSCPHGAEKFAK